jgi:hypothetical protein
VFAAGDPVDQENFSAEALTADLLFSSPLLGDKDQSLLSSPTKIKV